MALDKQREQIQDLSRRMDVIASRGILENQRTKEWSSLFKGEVKTLVENLSKEVKTEVKTVQETIENKYNSEREAEKRVNNIIIYRMKESELLGKEGNAEDKERVSKIIDTLSQGGTSTEEVRTIFRLGWKGDKVRPILIEFKDKKTKNLITENLRRIKLMGEDYKTIGVGHDFTEEQRGECRKLVAEAKMKESQNPGEFIFRVRGPPGNLRIERLRKLTRG